MADTADAANPAPAGAPAPATAAPSPLRALSSLLHLRPRAASAAAAVGPSAGSQSGVSLRVELDSPDAVAVRHAPLRPAFLANLPGYDQAPGNEPAGGDAHDPGHDATGLPSYHADDDATAAVADQPAVVTGRVLVDLTGADAAAVAVSAIDVSVSGLLVMDGNAAANSRVECEAKRVEKIALHKHIDIASEVPFSERPVPHRSAGVVEGADTPAADGGGNLATSDTAAPATRRGRFLDTGAVHSLPFSIPLPLAAKPSSSGTFFSLTHSVSASLAYTIARDDVGDAAAAAGADSSASGTLAAISPPVPLTVSRLRAADVPVRTSTLHGTSEDGTLHWELAVPVEWAHGDPLDVVLSVRPTSDGLLEKITKIGCSFVENTEYRVTVIEGKGANQSERRTKVVDTVVLARDEKNLSSPFAAISKYLHSSKDTGAGNGSTTDAAHPHSDGASRHEFHLIPAAAAAGAAADAAANARQQAARSAHPDAQLAYVVVAHAVEINLAYWLTRAAVAGRVAGETAVNLPAAPAAVAAAAAAEGPSPDATAAPAAAPASDSSDPAEHGPATGDPPAPAATAADATTTAAATAAAPPPPSPPKISLVHSWMQGARRDKVLRLTVPVVVAAVAGRA
ncbi:hypothetical protein HK405_009552 [Cladochytrium tenue]|nr:hypothetical protein HK405_009552 [Cladochytrium tenue]